MKSNDVTPAAAGRWGDLLPRVISALAMLAVGGGAILYGGLPFLLVLIFAGAGMIWELARMTRAETGRDYSLGLGVLSAFVLAMNIFMPSPFALGLLLLPIVAGLLTGRRAPGAWVSYSIAILACVLAVIAMRLSHGVAGVIWLVAVVVVSDVLGYFAGRILGGPKFWPAISPKKTWSGTVAGWLGASLLGLGFWAWGGMGAAVLWVSPLVAFAGQLGDIAESAIKRRAGVKDASNLIPGHGGLMDRFDALVFASVVALFLNIVAGYLPLVG